MELAVPQEQNEEPKSVWWQQIVHGYWQSNQHKDKLISHIFT